MSDPSMLVFARDPIILQPDEADILLVMDFTSLIPAAETIKVDPVPVVTVVKESDDGENEGDNPVLASHFTSIAPNTQVVQRDDGTTIAIGKAVMMTKSTASGTHMRKYRIEVKIRTSTTNQLREGDGVLWIVD